MYGQPWVIKKNFGPVRDIFIPLDNSTDLLSPNTVFPVFKHHGIIVILQAKISTQPL